MKKYAAIFFGLFVFIFCSANWGRADSLLIPSSAFNCNSGYDAQAYFYRLAYLAVFPGSTYRSFSAPVFLPDGARVTSVVVFYVDDSSAHHITVNMLRHNVYQNDSAFQNMANFTSSSDSAAWQSAKINPISYNLINNGGYTYAMDIYFSGAPSFLTEMCVKAVKILFSANTD